MALERITIWRLTFSHSCGTYWMPQRTTDEASAEAWLKVYRGDEPCATFTASKRKPKLPANADALARHVATF